MTTMVWEAAEGLAVARCQVARFRDPAHRVTPDHPSACVFCSYPDAELEAMMRSFNAWAGWNERAHAYDRHEVRVFREQKQDDQRAQITAAQELTGSPWGSVPKPEPVVAPAPTEPATPERPSWL